MRGVKEFLENSHAAMIDYIYVVSSPGPEAHGHLSTLASSERHNRLRVIDSLRQRSSTMPLLHQEAVPLLPHLLDVPRHLAIISSAVIRRSRGYHGKVRSERSESFDLVEFCERCYEIEEHALLRVNRLAGRAMRATARKRPSTSNVRANVSTTPTSSQSNLSPPFSSPTSSGRKLRSPQSSLSITRRPSTAPSPRDGPSEGPPPALPTMRFAEVSSSSQANGVSRRSSQSRPGLRIESRFPSTDATSLRRVQTLESPSTTPRTVSQSDEVTQKRKGFFRVFLSRK
jgi:hypothetical protein